MSTEDTTTNKSGRIGERLPDILNRRIKNIRRIQFFFSAFLFVVWLVASKALHEHFMVDISLFAFISIALFMSMAIAGTTMGTLVLSLPEKGPYYWQSMLSVFMMTVSCGFVVAAIALALLDPFQSNSSWMFIFSLVATFVGVLVSFYNATDLACTRQMLQHVRDSIKETPEHSTTSSGPSN